MNWYEDPVFIKMCDCPEIQNTWEPKVGDIVYEKAKKRINIIRVVNQWGNIYLSNNDHPFSYTTKDCLIWLPRQEDLQGMLVGYYVDSIPRKLIYALWDWIAQTAPPSKWSMNQLWLAFVMKTLHSKLWDGDKWKTD